MSYRLEKFASTLQRALAEILGQDSLNPGLQLVTVLRVLPAPDLKRATVVVSCPPEAAAAVLRQLQAASGFVKKQLARKMILRYMPELVFALDTSRDIEDRLEQAARGAGGEHETTDR